MLFWLELAVSNCRRQKYRNFSQVNLVGAQKSEAKLKFLRALVLISFLSCHFCAYAKNEIDIEQKLKLVGQLLKNDPQQANAVLTTLEAAQPTFNPQQLLHFQILKASALGFFNKHRERITYINGFIDSVQDPDIKSKFLYQLSTSYVHVGEYEKALDVMNTSINLLPRVTDTIARIDTFQSTIDLLNSLHAYSEALTYADRMYDLPVVDQDLTTKCIASTNRAEIYMRLNQRPMARAQMREAVDFCDKNGRTYVSLIVKTLAAIDLIDNHEYQRGIAAGLPALHAFPSSMRDITYVSQLEDGLARAYLQTGQLAVAESYGLEAYQHAISQKLVQETEKSLETLVLIKRAQTQYAAALDYAELALTQKNVMLDDQLQKNVAYQRVKFGMQDKSNQVSLLERENKILAIQGQLERKNSQNLWLIIALAAVIAGALCLYLWKMIRLKNFFHLKAQIDGLTHISNRSHFMTSAEHLVRERSMVVSLILFDMDFFKRVNDSFGHPVGDWVLSTVCQAVGAVLRTGDLFGRLGGEEFAICLPNTSAAKAMQLAQRCREAIAAIDTAPSGFQFPLSASFGVASISEHDVGNFANLLVAADKALYQAKSDGRNCVSA